MHHKSVSVALIVAGVAGAASADIVAGFTFNNTSSGPLAMPYEAEYGVGACTSNFVAGDVVSFAGTNLGGVPGDPVGRGAAFRTGEAAHNNGAYAQFAFDATGYADMTLTFATKTTANGGFTSMDIQVSGNGTDFITVQSLSDLRADTDWTLKSIDLAGASVLEDNADAVIRVVFSGGDAVNPVANTRIENFIIMGNAVPTPASVALIGLGGLMTARRRRA